MCRTRSGSPYYCQPLAEAVGERCPETPDRVLTRGGQIRVAVCTKRSTQGRHMRSHASRRDRVGYLEGSGRDSAQGPKRGRWARGKRSTHSLP